MNDETPSTFGDLLRFFRKRVRWTQRQLASALGVHLNTIGIWERGEGLPEQKGTILEIAKRLRLDEQESRHFLETSLTALVPYWSVPFLRNSLFTGREQILQGVHTRLGIDRIVALTQSYAIHGLGGIGKTQLAVEYVYRYALEYAAVFWISAQKVETILSSFLTIAEVLRLSERQEADQQHIVAAVQGWLNSHSKWLLIWDNLEEVELLRRYLPSARQGALLITTRRQGLGALAQDLELPTLTRQEGILLLLRRAKILSAQATIEHAQSLAVSHPSTYMTAQTIVTLLGELPLALDQAGAYIESAKCSIHDYLSLLQSSQFRLLDEHDASTEYPLSVVKTFTLILEQLEQNCPSAVEVVTVCAFLAPEAIPESFFLQGMTYLGTPFEYLATDAFAFQAALKALLASSLIQRDASTHTLSIHRLVQVVLKGRLSPLARRNWADRVTRTMAHLFPVDENKQANYWPLCEQLLSHALMCLSFDEQESLEEAQTLALMSHVATYLSRRARYAEAEPLFVRTAQIGEQILGPQHPQVAEALNGLGILYREQGKNEQAQPLLKQALSIWEQALGSDHPLIAQPLNTLGNLYSQQGKYEQAQPLLERALSIWEQALGSDHSQLATPLNNLGILYKEQGKNEQAERLYQRALHIREQVMGPDHPGVAYPLQNLGELYRDQGKYERAQFLLERALHIWEQALGSDHPLVAYPLDGLGELYIYQSKYEQMGSLLERARPLLERALRILEQAWGLEHLNIAYPLLNLGELYVYQGKYEQARPLLERALHIREQALDSDHLLIARSLNALANFYREQHQYEQAEVFYRRALRLRQEQRNPHSPEIAETLHDMAIFRQKQGNLSEAASLAIHALSICSQFLGDTHPQTLAISMLYAQLAPEHQRTEKGVPSPNHADEASGLLKKRSDVDHTSHTSYQVADPSPVEKTLLQEFLDACCELHPCAWSRASDLWEVYKDWVEGRQERFSLSRRGFTTQLKAHGCYSDRTKTARIWRGITLARKE